LNTDKKHIQHLAAICQAKGVTHAVISPGSRCAPLIIAFNRMKGIECLSVIDERSAAFVALGIAQQSQTAVALICTSGSAMLNYAPAIAEAFYQKIPLLVLSADRPNEWIDQGENQSINQNEVYKNYIKKSYQLPVQINTEKDLWYSDRIVAEAINSCFYPDFGPVHVNVPLREPLYNLAEDITHTPKIIDFIKPVYSLVDSAMKELVKEWDSHEKIMIVVGGLKKRDRTLEAVLQTIGKLNNVVVLKEAISNVYGEDFIDQIDANVEVVQANKSKSFVPSLVITLGAGVVSKKLKFWLRSQEGISHWHLTRSFEHWDIFQGLSKVLQHDALSFFEFMLKETTTNQGIYRSDWMQLNKQTRSTLDKYLGNQEFLDFTVFEYLLNNIPSSSLVQFGNSTPIRYANLLHIPAGKDFEINANRGVSGIDGVLSTALGASLLDSKKLCFCISGDIAALYDSNALMNDYLNGNFKLIIINNQGGNIFKIIPGPDKLNELEQFFETKHNYEFSHLAKMYSCKYFRVNNMEELANSFKDFVEEEQESAILEIRTDGVKSAHVLRSYFDFLKQDIKLN
jgi:2-succinyl-5-enolpyruvyl-6-hydroxy-3-cyclohexene-1-carboxylate synthase